MSDALSDVLTENDTQQFIRLYVKKAFEYYTGVKFGQYIGGKKQERKRIIGFLARGEITSKTELKRYFDYTVNEWSNWPEHNRSNMIGFIFNESRLATWRAKQKAVAGKNTKFGDF